MACATTAPGWSVSSACVSRTCVGLSGARAAARSAAAGALIVAGIARCTSALRPRSRRGGSPARHPGLEAAEPAGELPYTLAVAHAGTRGVHDGQAVEGLSQRRVVRGEFADG